MKMIKFKDGCCECSGTGRELLMELSVITKAVRENIARTTSEEFAEEKIAEMMERSKLPTEEIIKTYEMERAQSLNIPDDLKDLLKELLKL